MTVGSLSDDDGVGRSRFGRDGSLCRMGDGLRHVAQETTASVANKLEAKLKQTSLVFEPGPSEVLPLVKSQTPPPGSARLFLLWYWVLSFGMTFCFNFPWLPLLLLAKFGNPVFEGYVPTWWVYLQTFVFLFWNVLFFVVSDDYFTYDCVDGLRRLGVPHDRDSVVYRWLIGWWPKEFLSRVWTVTAVWTVGLWAVPCAGILILRPGYIPWSKLTFVLFVTIWASIVGSVLCMLLQVRAAGEGTSSPFFVRTNPYYYQQVIFKLAWRWAGAEDSAGNRLQDPGRQMNSKI